MWRHERDSFRIRCWVFAYYLFKPKRVCRTCITGTLLCARLWHPISGLSMHYVEPVGMCKRCYKIAEDAENRQRSSMLEQEQLEVLYDDFTGHPRRHWSYDRQQECRWLFYDRPKSTLPSWYYRRFGCGLNRRDERRRLRTWKEQCQIFPIRLHETPVL